MHKLTKYQLPFGIFLSITFLFLGTLASLMWHFSTNSNGSANLFLQLNAHHTPFFDVLFKYLTYLGDGAAWVICCSILLLRKSVRWFYISLIAIAISTLIAQTGKHLFFTSSPRPKLYFQQLGIPIRLIDGITIHSHNSFPSGHTTTVFTISMLLLCAFTAPFSAFWPKVKSGQIINQPNTLGRQTLILIAFFLAITSISTAYSRIYLAQHFPADVFAGTILGLLSATLSIYIGKKTKLISL